MDFHFTALAAMFLAVAVIAGPVCNVSYCQSAEERLQQARSAKQEKVEAYFNNAGLPYPPYQLFLRIFKKEKELEVWARGGKDEKFKLITTYPVCKSSGVLGPKRKQGDLQVPEGFYYISGFNPQSRFHLSMRINYPNSSDKKLGDKTDPGGDIFIHGNCVTIGCVPIRNGPIEELYIMALDVKTRKKTRTHVHIFPCRMDKRECRQELARPASHDPALAKFWNSLKPGYLHFEKNRTLPRVNTGGDGHYRVSSD